MANTRRPKVPGATTLKKTKRVAGYDILGNIALVKFPREMKLPAKKSFANKFLKTHKQTTTILEKSNKISGRLRTPKAKFIAGLNTKEALYKENNCLFRLNVESCYFSPRLSTDRLDVASKVKRNENVLVMFGGVAPYAIVIAKNARAKKVTSIELGRDPSKYAQDNVKRNKLKNVTIIQGNVRKKIPKEKYDRIIMARPNLKDPFLDIAFKHIKPKGTIHYHGFYSEADLPKLKSLLHEEAKKAKKKIKITKVKKAGEIAYKTYRYRVDFKVS